jgi:hypothetical protein
MLRKTLISFIIPFTVYANSDVDRFLDEEFYADIEQTKFETVDALGKMLKEKPVKKAAPKARYQRYREKWEPEPYKALLRKGSQLKDIETEKYVTLPRDMYVTALAKERSGSLSYVLTNSGEVKYITETASLTSIQEDLELYPPKPPIDPTIIYAAKTQKHSDDKALMIDAEISMINESISPDYFSGFLGDTINGSAGTSFEIKALIKNTLPINFGLILNVSSGGGDLESTGERFEWQGFNIGALIKYPFKKTENLEFSVHALAMRSLSFTASKPDSEDDFSFSASTYGLGIEAYYLTRYGDFGIGGSYRTTGLGVKKEIKDTVTYPSEKDNMTAFGLSFNYRYGFNL